jgi:uncharacterized delta-60 repeat protein
MGTKNARSGSFALSLCFGAVTVALGAPGELDPTFGTNGLVQIDVEQTGDAAAAVFAEADGTVLIGRTNPTSNRDDLSVLRLNADGTPDASFAIGGRTVFDVVGFHSEAFSVLSQSDGKVLAGGVIRPDHGPGGNWSEPLAVARFLADGRIDTSFGDAGIASVNFETGCCWATADARALLQQSDGKIVAAGTAAYGSAWGYGGNSYWPDMILTRLDVAGNLDTGFGRNGRVYLDPSAEVGAVRKRRARERRNPVEPLPCSTRGSHNILASAAAASRHARCGDVGGAYLRNHFQAPAAARTAQSRPQTRA